MHDYFKYQEQLNKLTEKKRELFETHKTMMRVQAKYIKYRDDNPYSKRLHELRQELHKRRAELMNLIPNKYV